MALITIALNLKGTTRIINWPSWTFMTGFRGVLFDWLARHQYHNKLCLQWSPPTSYISVSWSACQAFCSGLSARPKPGMLHFLRVRCSKGGIFSVEGGRQISQPPSTCTRGVAVPCRCLVLGPSLWLPKWERDGWGRVKGCGLSPWKEGDDLQLSWHIIFLGGFGLFPLAGRGSHPPNHSLAMDVCLSVCVCVCVLHSCACVGTLVLVHVHLVRVCLNVCVHMCERCALWKETPSW